MTVEEEVVDRLSRFDEAALEALRSRVSAQELAERIDLLLVILNKRP